MKDFRRPLPKPPPQNPVRKKLRQASLSQENKPSAKINSLVKH
jgi:hypothetical protein